MMGSLHYIERKGGWIDVTGLENKIYKVTHGDGAAREIEAVLAQHGRAADLAWASELFEREIDARNSA